MDHPVEPAEPAAPTPDGDRRPAFQTSGTHAYRAALLAPATRTAFKAAGTHAYRAVPYPGIRA
jgi:hypothetical protein